MWCVRARAHVCVCVLGSEMWKQRTWFLSPGTYIWQLCDIGQVKPVL